MSPHVYFLLNHQRKLKKPFVLLLSLSCTRHAAPQPALRSSEDRLPAGGIFSAIGAWNFVGDFEKIHTGEAKMRQRRSRVGELYHLYNSHRYLSANYKFIAADFGYWLFRLLSSVEKTWVVSSIMHNTLKKNIILYRYIHKHNIIYYYILYNIV